MKERNHFEVDGILVVNLVKDHDQGKGKEILLAPRHEKILNASPSEVDTVLLRV